jgi:hypothetical protein
MRCEVIGCVSHARGVRGEGEGKEKKGGLTDEGTTFLSVSNFLK